MSPSRPYPLATLLRERARMPEPLQGPFVDAVAAAERAMADGGASVPDVLAQLDADMASVLSSKPDNAAASRAMTLLRDRVAAFLTRFYPEAP